MKVFITFLFLIVAGYGFSQTYNMSNSSVSACSGTFYDSGGSGSDYSNNENLVFTICPGTAGNKVEVDFTAFTTQAGNDVLTIYDGSTTGATVIGSYSGGTSPGTIIATNAGGCLTFRFVTNNNNRQSGWAATISCVPPPPANDNCANAVVLTQSTTCSPTSGTVAGATNSGIASCTGTADDDVWYTFTATSPTAIIDRVTTGGWDSGIEIFASTGAAPGSCIGASLGCQDPESSFTVNGLTVGMNYYVRVYYWSVGGISSGGFTICVNAPPAGTVLMTNGSTTACGGTFYDMGYTTNYSNSQTQVFTICPSTAGSHLRAIFNAFQTETNNDVLQIFDGNSTAAPLIGTYSGTTSPGTVQASSSNASGCLTFRFTSDGSTTNIGWQAALSCFVYCQSITSNWVSSNEAPMGDGIIRICQGQSINLVGSGTFGTSGAGATYAWSMGNGVSVSGSNINYTYPAAGSYLANLVITDPSGCTNTNAINRNIQVSTTPTISTSASPSTLCTNQTSALSANVTMTPFTVNCTPPVSGTTFLPDGSGVSYSTSITTNCYSPGSLINSASDITNVCLTMEHSWLGDLQLELICPNGQTMILKAYSQTTNSSYFLGHPIDNDAVLTAGTGETYCFTPGATTYLVNGTTTAVTTPSSGTMVNPGNYMPFTSFNNMIGCPINGNWTIKVTDNISSDNGYIFDWDVNFNAGLVSAASFTPTIVSQGWAAATTLSSTGPTTANVTPTNQGTPCFNYSVTDNFGCTYTQPQCLTVNCGTSMPVGLVSFEATAVNNNAVRLSWETSSEQDNDYFVVERSVSGEDGWEEIATVDGAGNSETPKNYTDMDNMPVSGISYYRLKQVDFNGQERVHEMESVYIDAAGMGDLVIFPNPATGLVTLKGDIVSLSTFKLLNAMGQDIRMNVSSYKQGDGSLVLDISSLRAGVYMVKNGSKVYSLVKQ